MMPMPRLPAEWEPHEGTWLSWPNARSDSFHGNILDRVLPTFVEIVRALAGSETVLVNVSSEAEAEFVTSEFGGDVRCFHVPTNEPWCRDHGPLVVSEGSRRLAACWGFNAWGQKYEPYDLDASAAPLLADSLGVEKRTVPLIFEGGMIDSNGEGTALVARKSLFDPRRNPDLTFDVAEELLSRHLGIENPIWLDQQIPGDDTDGHVDVYARFVSRDKIIVCQDEDGAKTQIEQQLPDVEILQLEPPAAMVIDGQRVPAGYANFYIANRCVLVPVFGVEQDQSAISLLAECFATREIVPIDCRELVWGLGSIHCLTQPLPLV